MEKLTPPVIEELELLVKLKEFDALNSNEKAFVLKHLTEVEYHTMRKFYATINTISLPKKHEILPDEELKLQLMQRFQSNKSTFKISSFLNAKIPLYQVAAAAILFFVLGFVFTPKSINQTSVHDTIQVVKYLVNPIDTSFKNALQSPKLATKNVIAKSQKQNKIKKTEHYYEVQPRNPIEEYHRQMAIMQVNRVKREKVGSSLANEPEISGMIVPSI